MTNRAASPGPCRGGSACNCGHPCVEGLLALTLLGVLLSMPATGAESPTSGKQEEQTDPDARAVRLHTEVTVTATPIVEGSRLEPVAGAVTSVGRQQIEDLSAQDLASALRRVPGVVISRYDTVGSYGGGDGGAVFVRGMGAGRPGAEVTTMVDGVPKFVGVWTHPLLDTLSVDLLDRVDVYKGAQPILFGNMAFAGINLIPRHRQEEGFGGRISAGYGSFDTSSFTADTEGRRGRLDYAFAASQRKSDGQRVDAGGRTQAAFGRAAVDLGGGWEASVLFDGTNGRADDPGAVGAARPGVTPRFDVSDALSILTLSRRRGSQTGFVKVSLDNGSIDWRQWDADQSQAFRTLTDWRNWNAQARNAFGVGARGTLTLGLELQSYGGQSHEERPSGPTPVSDFRFQNRAAYAAYSQTFGDRVKVVPSAGVRYNDSRELGGNWAGQAGVAVSGGFGEAYLRWAHAFNLPGVWTAVFYQGYGRGDEWRSLEPEQVNQLEMGFARTLADKVKVETAVFRSAVKDALWFVPPPPAPPCFANLGDYRAQGIEVSVTAEPVRSLSLMAGWTVTRTHPDPIPFTPKITVVSGAVFARGRWRVASDAQYVDSRYVGNLRYPGQPREVDGYLLVNGRVALRLTNRQHGPEAFVAGENLTDADYAFRPGYPMPGRAVLSGVSWGF